MQTIVYFFKIHVSLDDLGSTPIQLINLYLPLVLPPTSGIPQGAVVLTLFALFFNPAPSVLHHAKVFMFSDAMKLFLRCK